jgi:hypothetical protein
VLLNNQFTKKKIFLLVIAIELVALHDMGQKKNRSVEVQAPLPSGYSFIFYK